MTVGFEAFVNLMHSIAGRDLTDEERDMARECYRGLEDSIEAHAEIIHKMRSVKVGTDQGLREK